MTGRNLALECLNVVDAAKRLEGAIARDKYITADADLAHAHSTIQRLTQRNAVLRAELASERRRATR